VSDEANLEAYLKRINYSGSIAPSLETLTLIQQLHPAAIPFENLDVMMELPVRLQLSDLEQKLIVEKRGGYCFEQNLLLRAVLETMDFAVTGLAARVVWNHAPEQSAPINHMALLVDVGGVPYLADAGFGGQVMTAPLKLKAGLEQETPNERYRLTGGEPDWLLETEIGGEWRGVFRFDLTPQNLDDYVILNDAAMVSMRDALKAARVEGGRRHALRNARYRIHEKGETTERVLNSVAELREVLTGAFGLQLPQNDRVEPMLERAIAAGAA
jgi:N-hydroxyarylamine O-acetyltransferase